MPEPTVMPGAEPFFHPGNDIGVLVCHGFTGTPQSMRPLGEHFRAAGYTVRGPLLKGHGTSPADMALSGASDWMASVDAALAELRKSCRHIFMAGLSMGGTLTLNAAARHADVIGGAIAINAPVRIGSPDLAGLALAAEAPPVIPGIGSDIKDPNAKELAYAELPVPALRQMYALAAVTYDLLPRIQCPVLVMQSREDHLVNPENARLIVGQLGGSRAELQWLDNSFHVATLDHDKDLIGQRAVAFVRGIAGR